jgi:integrase
MWLDSYVYLSRHGVFYFRWPLPQTAGVASRTTIRLSLGVRCPKQAGELSRYLASCGATIGRSGTLRNMRHDELRAKVHDYFKSQLEGFKERIDAGGLLGQRQHMAQRTSQALAEGPSEDFWGVVAPEGTDAFLTRFCGVSGIPEDEAVARPTRLLEEIKNAFRDVLRAQAEYQARLGSYDYAEHSVPRIAVTESDVVQQPSIPLSQAIGEYIGENRRANSWGVTTFDKKTAHLNTLIEVLGGDRQTQAITKQDALDLKRIVLALPKNRQKMPATRGLSIFEAIAIVGVEKNDAVTVNYYLGTFHSFFGWLVNNGYAAENPFSGIKVGKTSGKAKTKRKPFKSDALKAMHTELTQNGMALVKSQSHKWATLIGMFSGARLNEVCQLEVADVLQEGDIWYFNMTDEGENKKRLKTAASHRKVPVHAELLRLGLLEYREGVTRNKATRLFPDYSYEERGGYGRSLGRWFNGVFLVKLGLKSDEYVFHSFRHTMVNQLAQANVQEPIYQCIVGHERKGVTQEVYNREGFTVSQLKEAIDLFSI